MDKVSAIVLAAGLSRRMGEENKLFLAFKGKPLVAWVIEKISQSKADEIIIVTSELSKKLAGFANDKIKVVNNPDYKIGMTTSIQKGILATSESSIGYMICLGDQPLIEIADYNKIIHCMNISFRKYVWENACIRNRQLFPLRELLIFFVLHQF